MWDYKGYEIEKVTPKDYIIYKNGKYIEKLNADIYKGRRNAYTLIEARARIDNEEARRREVSD